MAEVVKMPKMSDTMTEGVLAKWHKKVGDTVKTGDLVAEIETDKATMDFESFQEGTLLYMGPKEGEAIPVDGLIAILGKPGEDVSGLIHGSAAAPEPMADPDQGKTSTGDEPASMMPSNSLPSGGHSPSGISASPAVPSLATPSVLSETVSVPAVTAQSPNAQTAHPARPDYKENGHPEEFRLKASPLAKKIAQDHGLDLASIKGSAEQGRIVKKDVEQAAIFEENKGSAAVKPVPPVSFSNTTMANGAAFEDFPISQMRKTIAKRLSESLFTAPHFYLTMSVDMDKAIELRTSLNELSDGPTKEGPSIKVSFNDLVLKAVAVSLKQHPQVNSSWQGDKIRVNHEVHIGVAVAVEDGLLVPVIKNADIKSLGQISSEVKYFVGKAKDKKLQPSDWEGSTFTISNLGMFGIDEFTAIINTPDACILAIGGIHEVPVIKNKAVVAGNQMKLTLSCDHRVVDGASGAAFLQTLKSFLENPLRMFL